MHHGDKDTLFALKAHGWGIQGREQTRIEAAGPISSIVANSATLCEDILILESGSASNHALLTMHEGGAAIFPNWATTYQLATRPYL